METRVRVLYNEMNGVKMLHAVLHVESTQETMTTFASFCKLDNDWMTVADSWICGYFDPEKQSLQVKSSQSFSSCTSKFKQKLSTILFMLYRGI